MSTQLTDLIAALPAFDQFAADQARARQDRLTKPQGSLGLLETLSVQIAGMTGQAIPQCEPPHIFVFAADHGVAFARPVSAYPPAVTAQMVLNFARSGAVINTLAAQIGAQLTVTDVGVAEDLPGNLPIRHGKVRAGTSDWTQGPAMTRNEAEQAICVGMESIGSVETLGLAVIGEMGIGNTTTAVVLTAALLGTSPENLVGRGTGVDDSGLAHKLAAIQDGLTRVGALSDPWEILAELGGFEIAAMAGAMLAAAARRIPIVLDGVIATSAALVAVRLAPRVHDFLIAGHLSPEPAHAIQLEALGLTHLLNLGMRLGEASGAALSVPIIRASLAVLRDVATFGEAGVSEKV